MQVPALGHESGIVRPPTPTPAYEWTQEKTALVASKKCNDCWATGLIFSLDGKAKIPCHCALLGIYKTVLRAYNAERHQEIPIRLSTRARRARRSADFIADFELCAKRVLTLNDYDVFRRYVIWEQPVPLERRSDLEQIELRLGRAFAETHPYALWPLHLYFGTTPRKRRRRS